MLGIRVPSNLDDRFHLTDQIPADQRPVVFIGPYEHHSNELPWRESIAEVVTIDEDTTATSISPSSKPSSSATAIARS